MTKYFCDYCQAEIVFFSDEPRRMTGSLEGGRLSFMVIPPRIEICEPCFNKAFESAFTEHQEQVLRLRAQKAKGFSVPDA
jgi:hypothetical protein